MSREWRCGGGCVFGGGTQGGRRQVFSPVL